MSFQLGEDGQEEYATLKLPDGRVHKMKIMKPTVGEERFLDIRDLHAKTNYLTFDPGFSSTGSCISAVTYVDGPQGVCLYRGYPVDELCQKSNAMEVAHLLLFNHLPDATEFEKFREELYERMMLHEKVKAMFSHFLMKAHPMAIMVAITGALASIHSEMDPFDPLQRMSASTRLIAQFPMIAAMSYKTSIGEPIMYPLKRLTISENFLRSMFGTPMEEYKVNPIMAKAVDVFMILHADHEQNASTSTVRIAGSSQANPYACIAAGVASLWGKAHGGANEAVIEMLETIGSKENVPQFIADVKAKKEGVRLMGFGHRVYKNYDPRAKFMKTFVKQVLDELHVDDPRLDLAMELERQASQDEYFLARKLYPNVDFFSGIMLHAMGIPTSMFTAMFAMSRVVGWTAQWTEMVSEGQMRIGRPRQLYVGSVQRTYEPPTREAPLVQRKTRRDSSMAAFEYSEEKAQKETTKRNELGHLARVNSSFRVSVPHVGTR